CLRFDQKTVSSNHLDPATRQNPHFSPWYIFCLFNLERILRNAKNGRVARFAAANMATSVIPKEIRPNSIAYFSMQVGLDSGMPTDSGGLGVLAQRMVLQYVRNSYLGVEP
ncbi:MAG TPA: hypothetical protein VFQ89_04530, partial [Candidatus Binatia bacterium]|nr:hypothetical protein [Candidatus Binatia bacterium]